MEESNESIKAPWRSNSDEKIQWKHRPKFKARAKLDIAGIAKSTRTSERIMSIQVNQNHRRIRYV